MDGTLRGWLDDPVVGRFAATTLAVVVIVVLARIARQASPSSSAASSPASPWPSA